MNRVHAAVVILVLLLAFALFGHLGVLRTTEALTQGLQTLEVQVQAQDYAAARRQAAQLQQLCMRREGLLTLFVKRDLVNSLCVCLQGVETYLNQEYSRDALLEIARARAQIQALQRQYFDVA